MGNIFGKPGNILGRPALTLFFNFWVEIPHSGNMVSLTICLRVNIRRNTIHNASVQFLLESHFLNDQYQSRACKGEVAKY